MSKKNIVSQTHHQSDNQLSLNDNTLIPPLSLGEYTKVGLYKSEKQSMIKANQALIKSMVRKLPKLKKSSKVLKLGSGYGHSARFLAEKYNCKIDCLDINETKNLYHQNRNEQEELDQFINIVTGQYTDIPFLRDTYNVVWSQDTIVQSSDKGKVFREVSRVLQPEGRFILTDILESKDCPQKVSRKTAKLLGLETLGNAKMYRHLARKADLERVYYKEFPQQLVTHFTKLVKNLEDKSEDIIKKTSKSTFQKTLKGYQQLIEAGFKGHLTWALLQFQKRNI